MGGNIRVVGRGAGMARLALLAVVCFATVYQCDASGELHQLQGRRGRCPSFRRWRGFQFHPGGSNRAGNDEEDEDLDLVDLGSELSLHLDNARGIGSSHTAHTAHTAPSIKSRRMKGMTGMISSEMDSEPKGKKGTLRVTHAARDTDVGWTSGSLGRDGPRELRGSLSLRKGKSKGKSGGKGRGKGRGKG